MEKDCCLFDKREIVLHVNLRVAIPVQGNSERLRGERLCRHNSKEQDAEAS
jgi:hypothetical protein